MHYVGVVVGLSLATWHGHSRALGTALVGGKWSGTVGDGHDCVGRESGDVTINIPVLSITMGELDTSLVNNSRLVPSIPKTRYISRYLIL